MEVSLQYTTEAGLMATGTVISPARFCVLFGVSVIGSVFKRLGL